MQARKQISIFLPLADWRAMRLEAARLRIPLTELCRRWMRDELAALRARHAAPRLVERRAGAVEPTGRQRPLDVSRPSDQPGC